MTAVDGSSIVSASIKLVDAIIQKLLFVDSMSVAVLDSIVKGKSLS